METAKKWHLRNEKKLSVKSDEWSRRCKATSNIGFLANPKTFCLLQLQLHLLGMGQTSYSKVNTLGYLSLWESLSFEYKYQSTGTYFWLRLLKSKVTWGNCINTGHTRTWLIILQHTPYFLLHHIKALCGKSMAQMLPTGLRPLIPPKMSIRC